MSTNILAGITRPGSSPLANPVGYDNPMPHSALTPRDRVIMEHWTPGTEGPQMVKRAVREGNILATIGLNNLAELLVSGAQAFSASNGWVRVMALGTGTTAAASTDTVLANSTASVHISAASMVASDAGNRTYQANATFDDGNAYTVNEAGLFFTNDATGSLIARTVLTGTQVVNKGASDTVYVSYQLIFGTAA